MLSRSRKPLALVKDHLLLARRSFALLRLGNRGDKFRTAAGLDNLLGRLPGRVQLPMPMGAVIRRIQDGMVKKGIGHRRASSWSEYRKSASYQCCVLGTEMCPLFQPTPAAFLANRVPGLSTSKKLRIRVIAMELFWSQVGHGLRRKDREIFLAGYWSLGERISRSVPLPAGAGHPALTHMPEPVAAYYWFRRKEVMPSLYFDGDLTCLFVALGRRHPVSSCGCCGQSGTLTWLLMKPLLQIPGRPRSGGSPGIEQPWHFPAAFLHTPAPRSG